MSFSFYIQSVERVVLSTFCSLLRYVICSVPLMYLDNGTESNGPTHTKEAFSLRRTPLFFIGFKTKPR